jgi:hypothetical protein
LVQFMVENDFRNVDVLPLAFSPLFLTNFTWQL